MLLSRHTKRRDLLALLGGTAALAPLTARAQSPQAVRKLGVLMIGAENEPDSKLRIAAFEEGLRDLGWHGGRNIRIEYRWAAGRPDLIRQYGQGTDRARARHHPCQWHAGRCGTETADPLHPDRFCQCF
jgi:hypothetical protein